jgi:hypothetical protein
VDGLIRLRERRLRLRRSGFRRSRVEQIAGVTRVDVDLRVGGKRLMASEAQRPLGTCQASSLSAFLVVSSRQLVAPGGGGAASIDANCASTPAAGVQQESLP